MMRDGMEALTLTQERLTELGLPNFLHIHNAVLRKIAGRLYVIAQAWNPGDFVVLFTDGLTEAEDEDEAD